MFPMSKFASLTQFSKQDVFLGIMTVILTQIFSKLLVNYKHEQKHDMKWDKKLKFVILTILTKNNDFFNETNDSHNRKMTSVKPMSFRPINLPVKLVHFPVTLICNCFLSLYC